MNRFPAFVGTVALVAVQPAIALGAHPGGFAPAPMSVAAPRAAPRSGSANQTGVKAPFEINVQPKALPDARHFPFQSPTVYGLHPPLSLYRWYNWPSMAGYLWFPTLLQPACYANGGLWGSTSNQQPPDLTIGSLVDGKADLLSAQSFTGGFAANDAGVTSGTPFTLQAGFSTPACGPTFTSF